jgi:hypothetical protein
VGEAVGEKLLRCGADAILAEIYGQNVVSPQQP